MKLSTKVLVIGGGPAGSTAARLLAAQGTDVILLEKNPAFVKPCGGGVALSAFDELGIPHTVIKKEVKTIRLISPRGKEIDISLSGGSLAIVERGEFDRILRSESAAWGAKILEGEFIRLERENCNKAEVKVGDVPYKITSEYIIAADGVNSRVRTALGLKSVRSLFTASAHLSSLQSESCEFWFGSSHAPYSYSWVFPASEGSSIGTGTFEQGKIIPLFEKFKDRKGIEGDIEKRIYRIPVWSGDLYNIGNVLFTGDSAGQVMPLTYEGIYYAMKAGEYAAASIIEGRVLNYKKRWRDRFQKRFMLMDKLRNYFLKNDASAEKLVDLHRRQDVQEASLRLWLRKDSGKGSLSEYLRIFRKFV
jgi:geranylgeranyl diphosphate/geranylgeranyl-bacteriochlorophyllide a reductase